MIRKAHKERAQPSYRAHMGLLEKHKDYKLRAKDYARKSERIKSLKRQAEERNPDEFNFRMTKSKTRVSVFIACSLQCVSVVHTRLAGRRARG